MLLKLRIFFCKLFHSPSFIIKFENGAALLAAGKVRQSFVQDCQEIANLNQVRTGFVFVKNNTPRKGMVFSSREISREMLQQLRNCWNA